MQISERQIAACEEWCRSHYWQIQEKRGWRYKYHESVMVRYYEEANLDPSLLEPLLEYLKNGNWQTCCTIHNKPFDATGWVTRDTWYQTGDGDTKETTKLKVTRIYHAMSKAEADGEGDGPYVIEDGCAIKVDFEFHWNQTELPEIPKSESGISYRLTGVERDRETGLISCVLERRERVEQKVPEYLSETDAFKSVKLEEANGVKGDTSAGGKAASVSKGKVVRRRVSKNEDCTHNVENTTVESKEAAGTVTETSVGLRGASTLTVNRNMPSKANETGLLPGESVRNEQNEDLTWNQTIRSWSRSFSSWVRGVCRRTIFRHTHAVTTARGTDPGFTHATSAGGGEIHEIDVQRTEQGWEVTNTTTTDAPVEDSVTERRVYIDGVVDVKTNANQPGPASTAEIGVGGSVRNEKTESGLFNQTITVASPTDVGKTGEACEKSALVHEHVETKVLAPDSSQLPPSVDVNPSIGQTLSIRVESTERGSKRVVETTRSAVQSRTQTHHGNMGRTVDTVSFRNNAETPVAVIGVNKEANVSASVNDFGLMDGVVSNIEHHERSATAEGGSDKVHVKTTVKDNAVSFNAASPGRNEHVSASVEQNELGSYNVRETVTKYEERSANAHGENAHYSEDVVDKSHAGSIPSGSAGTGETKTVSASQNTEGTFETRVVKRTAKKDVAARTECGSSKAKVTVENFVNKSEISEQFKSSDEVGKETSANFRVNEFGLYDGTVTTTEYDEKSATAEGGSDKVHVKTIVKSDAEECERENSPGTNVSVSFSAEQNNRGTFSTHETVTEYEERRAHVETGNAFYDETVVDLDHTTDDKFEYPFDKNAGEVVIVNASQNAEGSFSKRIVTRRGKKAKWEVEVSMEMSYHRTLYFRNATEKEYRKFVKDMADEIDEKVKNWIAEERPPSTHRTSPNVQMNEMGLFDGNVSIDVNWAPGSAGQTGETNKVIVEKRIRMSGGKGSCDQILAYGRGFSKLLQYIEDYTRFQGNAHSARFRFDYNESTGGWSFSAGITD